MFFISKIKEIFLKYFRRARKKYSALFSYYFLREKILLFILAGIIILSLGFLLFKGYLFFTREIPLEGGSYNEGIVGQPKTINPLYSSSNLPDRVLVSLIYSGLTKISEDGNVVPDLAESWEVQEGGKKIVFKLRKNLKWDDGEQILSNDVRYTISVIQDPDYEGPLKNLWKNVNIDTPDEFTVIFTLGKPSSFIYNTTLGILPEHIWARFEVKDLPYVEQNFRPVGAGKFKFKEIKSSKDNFIKDVLLERNENFYAEKPLLDSVIFKFYKNPQEVFDAFTKKEIMGITEVTPDTYSKIKKWERVRLFSYTLPNYKAVFINASKNSLLENVNFRTALELALDRDKLVNKKLAGKAIMLDGIYSEGEKVAIYNLDKAKEIVKNLEMTDSSNDGFLEKDGKKIELKLSVADDEESGIVSEGIKSDWAKLGVQLNIEKKNILELERDIIKPRNFELLFFGQNFGYEEDLYPFWHSSQRKDPGLNFTSLESKRIDILLENSKQAKDKDKKKEINRKINEVLIQEKPAIFLYSSIYNFVTEKKLKGVKKYFLVYPKHHLIKIEKWYIKSKRIFNF